MTEEMKQAIIDEIKEYCRDNDEDFDLHAEQALRNWGRKEPTPLEFRSTIDESAQEWFWDNFTAEDFT